mmetsp:Transcript_100150/g.238797  ORF Transcript_100150/g.238797 Transcript_100150/m.238797 type:complete len:209 (-) Transcript_100150:135-761(-)
MMAASPPACCEDSALPGAASPRRHPALPPSGPAPPTVPWPAPGSSAAPHSAAPSRRAPSSRGLSPPRGRRHASAPPSSEGPCPPTPSAAARSCAPGSGAVRERWQLPSWPGPGRSLSPLPDTAASPRPRGAAANRTRPASRSCPAAASASWAPGSPWQLTKLSLGISSVPGSSPFQPPRRRRSPAQDLPQIPRSDRRWGRWTPRSRPW